MILTDILSYAFIFSSIGFSVWYFFQPGELLDFWPVLVGKAIRVFPDRFRGYVEKPLFGCLACMSAQIALWVSLFYVDAGIYTAPIVSFTILISWFIGKIETAFSIWI